MASFSESPASIILVNAVRLRSWNRVRFHDSRFAGFLQGRIEL